MLIGISIAIPEPWGEWLREKRRSFGDPGAEHIPSHITLSPPLEIDARDLESLGDALEGVGAEHHPFTVALAGTGTFRPVSDVVYIVVRQGVPESAELARGVQAAASAPQPEHDFHPHVTVAHELDHESLDRAAADLADFECEFEVDEFKLYVHDDERGWEPVRSFALGAASPSSSVRRNA